MIEAYVTEIVTRVCPRAGPASSPTSRRRATSGSSSNAFRSGRISGPGSASATRSGGYAELAEAVEAWGFRLIQGLGEIRDRREIAQAWFNDEYVPVIEDLREADLIGDSTETEAYFRVTCDRYMLLRTHDWDESIIERLREARR